MKNITASVLAKLKNVSKARGMVYNEVLVRYGIERTLKRLERSSYVDSCVLKGGTGLGLAIVKHAAKLHGGEVSLTSELCHGSTFTITLPL